MKCCCSIEKTILYICKYEYRYFFQKANVVGVGLGYKVRCGFRTLEKCIVVYVTKKISSNNLNYRDIVPLKYKSISTDVVECGYIAASSLTTKIRPVVGGYSISNIAKKSETGTYGCLVYNGNKVYMLANNHTIADENKADIGSSIIQPGKVDGGKIETDVVAHLSRFIPLYFTTSTSAVSSPVNYADCAIGEVVDKSIAIPKIAYIGGLKGVKDAKVGENVQKVGRTSDRTTGVVQSIGTTITINYFPNHCIFQDQVITNNMSYHGDSGAILVDNNRYALGMLCASSLTNTIYNSMSIILKLLSVHLLTE